MASLRLGEPQRALLAYYAHMQTRRVESQADAGECRWLLVQSEHGWVPQFTSPQQPVQDVSRIGDDKERYLLYALPAPLAQMGLSLK